MARVSSSSRLPAASPVASRISWGPLYSKLAPALSKIAPTNSGGYKRVFCDRIPGRGRSPFAVGSSVQAMLNPAGVLLSQTIHTSYNARPGRRSLFAPGMAQLRGPGLCSAVVFALWVTARGAVNRDESTPGPRDFPAVFRRVAGRNAGAEQIAPRASNDQSLSTTLSCIIELAEPGERDPIRLREGAIKGF